jgi:hypothetical protein
VACGLTAHQRGSALEPLSSGAFCCAPAPRRAELEVLLISQVRNKRGRKRKPQNRISHVTNSSKRGRISNVTTSEAGHTLAIPSSEDVVASPSSPGVTCSCVHGPHRHQQWPALQWGRPAQVQLGRTGDGRCADCPAVRPEMRVRPAATHNTTPCAKNPAARRARHSSISSLPSAVASGVSIVYALRIKDEPRRHDVRLSRPITGRGAPPICRRHLR